MTITLHLNTVPENQLRALAAHLGMVATPPLKRLINDLNDELSKFAEDRQIALLMEFANNRWLYSVENPPSQIREDLITWLGTQGAPNVTEISNEFIWAKQQGIEWEESNAYWNEELQMWDSDLFLPDWLAYGGYYHLSALIGGVEFRAEMVRQLDNLHESALLVRLGGNPPFSTLANSLRDFLQQRHYQLIDNRSPYIAELSRSPDGAVYFRIDPNDQKRRLPYLEMSTLLQEALKATDEAVEPNNSVQRTILIFQLHSLADHATSLFLNNLRLKSATLPANIKTQIPTLDTLRPKIDLLHNIAVLLGWEYDSVVRSNDIRNRLYHAEESIEAQYVDFQEWYAIPAPMLLVPVPRPGDLLEFRKGIQNLSLALGLGEYSNKALHLADYRTPSRVRDLRGEFAGRVYLSTHPIKNILKQELAYHARDWSRVCESCGMRMFGIEIPRCPFCCRECGSENALLYPTRACNHDTHPIFAGHGRIIEACLRQIDAKVSEGKYAQAILLVRLAFDAAVGAFWLQGKNYFDVTKKIRDYGVCLTANHGETLKSRPAITQNGRGRGIPIMLAFESYPDLKSYYASTPSEDDYKVVRDLLDKALDEFNVRNLPTW